MNNISLTYTQCKTLLKNDFNLRDIIEEWNNQPAFLEFMGVVDSVEELASIINSGCASGAYMPAVNYYTALKCMTKHYASTEEQISLSYGDELAFTFNPSKDSFSHFCSELCSRAVEAWAGSYSDLVKCLRDNGCL